VAPAVEECHFMAGGNCGPDKVAPRNTVPPRTSILIRFLLPQLRLMHVPNERQAESAMISSCDPTDASQLDTPLTLPWGSSIDTLDAGFTRDDGTRLRLRHRARRCDWRLSLPPGRPLRPCRHLG
jgi:hypothetical protein